MSVFSRTVSKAAKPITAAEFYLALRHAWKPKYQSQVQTLGLAVSGGVDSMALAYLCQSMKELDTIDRDGLNFCLTAYVVDHRARDGSTDEANLVVKRLRRLGVKSRVLELDWPRGSKLSQIANFESEARRFRYRLLGHACREQSIESLLLAHHADDQAETVLVRLSMGHKITGLQGIQQSADIPECWGIHGLCQSGGCTQKTNNRISHRSIKSRASGNTRSDATPIRSEDGGISLYRPLLSFGKERLIATCLAEGVEWVEDETNQDPTLTIRNTARQLLTSGRLPVALRKPSMIVLAKSARSSVVALEKSAERLRHACDILSFDNRVGSLVVRFSKEITSFNLLKPYTQEEFRRKEFEHLSSVSILLRRLIELVSPLETVRLQSLQAAAKIICRSKDAPPGFTAGCVRFQRSESVASDSGGRSRKFDSASTSEGNRPYSRRDTSDNQIAWTLSRQPYFSKTAPPTILVHKQTATKDFVLWDGRFWTHLQNDTTHDICVRPLCTSDSTDQLASKFTKANRNLRSMLHEFALGDIRWTLPVIAFADHVTLPSGVRRVIAIPSLNITFGKHNSLINWAIRYKKVDLGFLHSQAEPVKMLQPKDVIHADALGGGDAT
ncbi:hypothetical protein MMC15_001503 [Xylographa vitiligo]|nr:hypothetical protein [Xylographa vitiligo]